MPARYARCYAPGARLRSRDYSDIRVEDARALVADNLAELVNHGKDIRMFALTLVKTRDRSCPWRDRLMELNSRGDYLARKMTEAINPAIWRQGLLA